MSLISPSLRPLLPAQQRAATAPVGPTLILGGPGTGKSHCIAARIGFLLKDGEPATAIALLTKAEGASHDMKDRVRKLVEPDDVSLGFFVGTPIRFALDLLRDDGMAILGRSADFTVWEQPEAREFVADVLLKGSGRNPWDKLDMARRILRWHGLNRARFPGEQVPPPQPHWQEVVQGYETAKVQQNMVDAADLVILAIRALEKDSDFRASVTSFWSRHLLIDGLQDFNPAEYLMVKSLTGRERSITVTANPDESVRLEEGADDRVLDLFKLDHQGPRRHTYSLSSNLRMTDAIGAAVNRIAADPSMEHLTSDRQEFLRISYMAGETTLPMAAPELMVFEGRSTEMYRGIFDHIRELTGQGHSLADMACICADEASIESLRVLAVARGIPYTSLGVAPLPRDRDVKCIMGLLTSLVNPHDMIALRNGVRVDPRLDRQTPGPGRYHPHWRDSRWPAPQHPAGGRQVCR